MEMMKILAVGIIFLFIGVSVAPTINFNTVKASQQNLIREKINQRELLFQTIVDIANNKEIQRIILKSQISRGIFPTSEFPVVTKNQLKMMYFLGMILSKVISKSRIQSLIDQNQFGNHGMQQEIAVVIQTDATLDREVTQLLNSECGCDNEQTFFWHFPILCTILEFAGTLGFLMTYFGPFPTIGMYLVGIYLSLGTMLNCYWL